MKARQLAATSVLPFAALLFAVLTAVIITVFALSQRAAMIAEARDREIVARALAERVTDLARSLGAIAELERPMLGRGGLANDHLIESYLDRVRRIGDFDTVSLIGPDGRASHTAAQLVFGQEDPSHRIRSGLAWAASQLKAGADARVVGRYAFDQGGIRLVGIARLGADGDQPAGAIVAMRLLDEEGVARLGRLAALRDLRLAAVPAGSAVGGLEIPGFDGAEAGRLIWRPERPGDPIIQRLLPVAAFSALAILLFGWLAFAHVARVTDSVIRNEERAHHLAGHDTLSGLPNRLRFTEKLEALLSRCREDGRGLAILFIDLDKFKEVNDTYGHAAGDQVIIGCAERMAAELRPNDVLARFGGDEFAIIQHGVRSAHEAEQLGRRIIAAIRPPFRIGSEEASVGASVGVVLAPQDAEDAPELMRLADIAMYRAKNEGRNRVCFFERGMDETLRLRRTIEDDLRNAIARNELELHYQPQVTADGARIVGVEALVRWRHPTRGLIPPAEFISVAEERGIIIPLGEWVIRRACLDAIRWPGITVSCNVSAIQFRQPDFVRSVAAALSDTNFDPARLELELTESIVVSDADKAEESMVELRAMGVRLALDDFGTGYSSLIYLRRFAFDKIKLDKSFLDSLEDTGESAILVHSVVHLGRALGLTVIAEGVETVEQQRFLQAVGCHELQGYLFSKPVRAEEIDRMLARPNPFADAA